MWHGSKSHPSDLTSLGIILSPNAGTNMRTKILKEEIWDRTMFLQRNQLRAV